MHHEFCVTFVRSDAAGEPVEVHHRHVEADTDEAAAIAAAMEAARNGTDVSDCDVMIKVIKVVPPELRKAIKLVMQMYAIFRPESDPLSYENIKKGVAESVGGKLVGKHWEFPTTDAEQEFHRRLANVTGAATHDTGKPKTNLH